MRRRRMHGRLRRKSSCKPSPLKSDPKKSSIELAAEHGPKFDIPKDSQEYIDQDKVDFAATRKDYDVNKYKDKVKIEEAERTGVSNIQKLQTGLTAAEFAEGPIGTIAGGANMLISGGRGMYHAVRGEGAEAVSNFTDAGLSLAGVLPIVGNIATASKGGKALKIAGRVGQARHMDDGIQIVTGRKVGDALSPEKNIIKKLNK